jgi:hypothetical protein
MAGNEVAIERARHHDEIPYGLLDTARLKDKGWNGDRVLYPVHDNKRDNRHPLLLRLRIRAL